MVSGCLNHLYTDPLLLQVSNGEPVTVTAGFSKAGLADVADLTELYKDADEALYKAKKTQNSVIADSRGSSGEFAATGTFPVRS